MPDLSQNMRYRFAQELLKLMRRNEDVYLLIGDLGYKIFDEHRAELPDRVINCGAAEQAMMGMGVGLAQVGKIPFVYSITTFLLYRPFETIRTYIDHEKTPVVLIGSGRDKDYVHDGISHWAEDDRAMTASLVNIERHWPKNADEITSEFLDYLADRKGPKYVNLKR